MLGGALGRAQKRRRQFVGDLQRPNVIRAFSWGRADGVLKREPTYRPRPLELVRPTQHWAQYASRRHRCVTTVPPTSAFRRGANVKSAAVWRGVRWVTRGRCVALAHAGRPPKENRVRELDRGGLLCDDSDRTREPESDKTEAGPVGLLGRIFNGRGQVRYGHVQPFIPEPRAARPPSERIALTL